MLKQPSRVFINWKKVWIIFRFEEIVGVFCALWYTKKFLIYLTPVFPVFLGFSSFEKDENVTTAEIIKKDHKISKRASVKQKALAKIFRLNIDHLQVSRDIKTKLVWIGFMLSSLHIKKVNYILTSASYFFSAVMTCRITISLKINRLKIVNQFTGKKYFVQVIHE